MAMSKALVLIRIIYGHISRKYSRGAIEIFYKVLPVYKLTHAYHAIIKAGSFKLFIPHLHLTCHIEIVYSGFLKVYT